MRQANNQAFILFNSTIACLCRSSVANDVHKNIYGSFVPVLKDEKLFVRILVSTVKAFYSL